MARLVVLALLLAAVAIADNNYTVYRCGRTPMAHDVDDCKVKSKVSSDSLDTCVRTTTKSFKYEGNPKSTVVEVVTVQKYECSANGIATIDNVKDYEEKSLCKEYKDVLIDLTTTTTTTTTTTASTEEPKKDKKQSAKLMKSGSVYTLYTCTGPFFCQTIADGKNKTTEEKKAEEDNCDAYTIDVTKSEECLKSGDVYYKVKEVTRGNELYWVELYSASECKEEAVILQGEFLADDLSCTEFAEQVMYGCEAPAHYAESDCGYVTSCDDCKEKSKPSKTRVEKCDNRTREYSYGYGYRGLVAESSSKLTCSNGKVSRITYSDDSCAAEVQSTDTAESCYLYDVARYVKYSNNVFFICPTETDCIDSNRTKCTNYTLASNLDVSGDCKLQAKAKGDDKEFSYKATKEGDNKYRVALYDDRKCEKGLKFQGEFTDGKCVKVRSARKTECSSSFATATLLAVSVIATVVSMLF